MNILLDLGIGICLGFSLYMLRSTSYDNNNKLRFSLYITGWVGAVTFLILRLGAGQ